MNTVKDIMSPIPCLLAPEDALVPAVKLMSEHGMSCVLVCEQDVPVGIVTERDIVRVYARMLDDPSLREISVQSVMTREPICIEEHTTILDALVLARSRNVRHVPVINVNQRLVGVVTQTDAINAFVKSIEINAKLSEEFETLKMLSLEDPLVGAGNRRALEVDLAHTDASTKRYNKPYSIAMIDIDFFKRYNDFYGHQKGDEALIAVVDTIKEHMRDSDRLYRYGGEEFLLLMSNTDLDQSFIVAERIRHAIEQAKIPHQESPNNVVTVSVGVARNNGQAETIIKNADKALYEAKNSGRNKTCRG